MGAVCSFSLLFLAIFGVISLLPAVDLVRAGFRTRPAEGGCGCRPVGELHFLVWNNGRMQVVHVHVYVKAEFVAAFAAGSAENARCSIEEAGIARFDLLQQADDPARFILVEIYRTLDAAAAHKATPHYALWRDTVAEIIAEPRSSTKHTNLFPDDHGW